MEPQKLREGIDYYVDDDGHFVFTREYHVARGHCCLSGCRHCPFGYQKPSLAGTDGRAAGEASLSTGGSGTCAADLAESPA